jgi:hypothetical protein
MISISKFAHLWDNAEGNEQSPTTPQAETDGTDFTELFSSFGFEPTFGGGLTKDTPSPENWAAAVVAQRTLSSSSNSSWNSDSSANTPQTQTQQSPRLRQHPLSHFGSDSIIPKPFESENISLEQAAKFHRENAGTVSLATLSKKYVSQFIPR